jgi:hypothetical protein
MSIQQHTTLAQARLEAVAARHFRAATPEEREQYIRIYQRVLGQHSLSRSDQTLMDQVEKECTFADLVGMRAAAFSTVHQATIEQPTPETEKVPVEEKPKGFWETLYTSFAGLINPTEDETQEQAPSKAVGGEASVHEQKFDEPAPAVESSQGQAQAHTFV